MDWGSLVNAMVTGLFVGVGSTVGGWVVNRHFLRHLEALERKWSELDKKKAGLGCHVACFIFTFSDPSTVASVWLKAFFIWVL